MVGQVNQEQAAGADILLVPPAPALVYRIKLSLPMFAFNLVQQHAPAGKKFFNARGPVFAIAAGH